MGPMNRATWLQDRRMQKFGEAFSRTAGDAAQFWLGLQLDQDAAAGFGSARSRAQARRAPAQARTQALRRHDAASGWQPACLAFRTGPARSDRDHGRRDERD